MVQGPISRMRATKESDGVYVPNELIVELYSQRASKGGLLITEATPISRYVGTYISMCFTIYRSLLAYN